MTFEYIAPAGAMLHVDAVTRRDGTPVVELSAADGGQFTTVQVLVDRVEEVIAGIRDAARTASGQQPETTPCGSRSLPTYSGAVVRCVLKTGHAAQCQSAAEYPYVSWPNPSHGVWNPHPGDEPAPAVGQPAEAQATDRAALRERVRLAVAQWHLDESGSGRTIYDLDDTEFGTLADAVLSVLTVEDER